MLRARPAAHRRGARASVHHRQGRLLLTAEGAAGRVRLDRCVAFVDLAGFTALTQAHGDDYAADVHDAFLGALDDACALSPGVTCVKHLGDGALLTADDVPSMIASLQAGFRGQDDEELCLRARAGVHTGRVLQVASAHGPDVLGHTVNVAARLCGLAAPGEVLLSSDAVQAAVQHHASARRLGPRALRHIAGHVEVWSLPLGTQDGLIDPVCHMTVRPGAVSATVGGQERLFCSDGCRRTFLAAHG